MTESPPPSTAESAPAGPRKYPRERRVVGVIVLGLIAAIIVNGVVHIFQETYRTPRAPSPYANCSDGIADLYNDYAGQLSIFRHSGGRLTPYRPLEDPSVRARLDDLDAALEALRPVCEREGPDAHDAFQSLEMWRHRLQDISRIEERTLTPDAERALRYRSAAPAGAPAAAPAPSTPPTDQEPVHDR